MLNANDGSKASAATSQVMFGSKAILKTQRYIKKKVTVDLSAFSLVPSYSFRLTFHSIDHPGKKYVFKADAESGYTSTTDMDDEPYRVDLAASSTANLGFRFSIYSADINAAETNNLELFLNYGQPADSATVHALSRQYDSNVISR